MSSWSAPMAVGKSTLARNIAHHALIYGHTVLFTSAGQLLGDLAALDSDSTLRRRLRHYAHPDLLAIDEVGYLSYSNRHADLLFKLVSRRYERKGTLISTNRPFAEWREVFRNAACVVSLVDRLVYNAEILAIDGESYRLKEAQGRSEQHAQKRRRSKSCPRPLPDCRSPSRSRSPPTGRPEQAFAAFELVSDPARHDMEMLRPAAHRGIPRPAPASCRRPCRPSSRRSTLLTAPRSAHCTVYAQRLSAYPRTARSPMIAITGASCHSRSAALLHDLND